MGELQANPLFDLINDAIIVYDSATGKILDVNQIMCKMYGYYREEALQLRLNDFCLEEKPFTIKEALNWIRKATQGETPLFEWRNKSKSGEPFWVEVNLKRADIDGKNLILAVIRNITERKRLFSVLEGLPAMVYLQAPNYTIRYANRYMKERYGDPEGKCCYEIFHDKNAPCDVCNLSRVLETNKPHKWEANYTDGSVFELHDYPFTDTDGSPLVLEFGIDISERKRAEALFEQLFENSPQAILMLDKNQKTIKINKAFQNLFQYSVGEVEGQHIKKFIVPAHLQEEYNLASRVLKDTVFQCETVRSKKDGTLLDVSLVGFPISIEGNQVGTYVIYSDISERKRSEEKLKFLSLHDPLTGLYNRTYFELEMNRIEGETGKPVGILICDIDGLKLVNDAMGHDKGDTQLIAAADILSRAFRKSDIISRIGGDEFAVLLSDCDESVMENACKSIENALAEYNAKYPAIALSMSIGFAICCEPPKNMRELFKKADNNMYREKLHRSKSARSAIVHTLMKALEVRDYITEGHADRLQNLVTRLGRAAGLPERSMNDLRLLAQFHDIGKVGIPDRILFKPGPLTTEEIKEMKRHSEIGHRIALSAPDLVPIADWILKHHEWWNGRGYPLGVKGEEIPLSCRILAIADAYDAMTSDRPYRKAMQKEDALNELKKCAGKQFDPRLVNEFIELFRGRLYLKVSNVGK